MSRWIVRFGTPATITTDRGAQFESRLWDKLCNKFGIIRNRTTSYHPQSNGMVERFHHQLKTAIMAHEPPNPWTTTLPAVLLSIRIAVKGLLGRSAAEMDYGTTLRLPGEFTGNNTVVAHTDLNTTTNRSLRWTLQGHIKECSKSCRKARLKRSLQTASNHRTLSVSLSQVPHKSVKCNPNHYPGLISPLRSLVSLERLEHNPVARLLRSL